MRNIPKMLIFLVLAVFLFGSNAIATTILDPNNGEKNLYEIWNEIFTLTSGDSYYANNSQDLFDSPLGLPDNSDDTWSAVDGRAQAAYTYAGYQQRLGYTSTGWHNLVIQYSDDVGMGPIP